VGVFTRKKIGGFRQPRQTLKKTSGEKCVKRSQKGHGKTPSGGVKKKTKLMPQNWGLTTKGASGLFKQQTVTRVGFRGAGSQIHPYRKKPY